MATATRRPAKKAETKKTTKKGSTLDISFESDIPKISREGTERKSKYDTLLDKIQERAASNPENAVAVLAFDSSGKATSRYTSVKSAVEKREDTDNWTVAVRTHADDDVRLYIKWSDEAEAQGTEDDEPEEEQDDDSEDVIDF